MERDAARLRPWTVKALVAIQVVGLLTSVYADWFSDEGRRFSSIPGYVLGALIAVALWRGRSWAYALMTVLIVVSLFAFVVLAATDRLAWSLGVWAAPSALASLYLIRHPSTRDFIAAEDSGMERRSDPSPRVF